MYEGFFNVINDCVCDMTWWLPVFAGVSVGIMGGLAAIVGVIILLVGLICAEWYVCSLNVTLLVIIITYVHVSMHEMNKLSNKFITAKLIFNETASCISKIT